MTLYTAPLSGQRFERTRGFTLIELMVTLAVAAVMMTLAAPSFVAFMRNSELVSQANAMVAALNTARTEAMKRGLGTMVVPKDGQAWTSGWRVFVDINGDNAYTDGTDVVVTEQPALPVYFMVSATGTAGLGNPYVLYNSSGYPALVNGGFGAVTISIARTDLSGQDLLDQTRRVKLASTGRVRTCKPASTTDSQCSGTQND